MCTGSAPNACAMVGSAVAMTVESRFCMNIAQATITAVRRVRRDVVIRAVGQIFWPVLGRRTSTCRQCRPGRACGKALAGLPGSPDRERGQFRWRRFAGIIGRVQTITTGETMRAGTAGRVVFGLSGVLLAAAPAAHADIVLSSNDGHTVMDAQKNQVTPNPVAALITLTLIDVSHYPPTHQGRRTRRPAAWSGRRARSGSAPDESSLRSSPSDN